jgi:integration host factor subunit alpha
MLLATCTKQSIVNEISETVEIPTKKSLSAVESLIEIIKTTLGSGEDVMISGFGKFCVNEKAQRKGRNPATGKTMMLAPRRVVTFKCSGSLRDQINSK